MREDEDLQFLLLVICKVRTLHLRILVRFVRNWGLVTGLIWYYLQKWSWATLRSLCRLWRAREKVREKMARMQGYLDKEGRTNNNQPPTQNVKVEILLRVAESQESSVSTWH